MHNSIELDLNNSKGCIDPEVTDRESKLGEGETMCPRTQSQDLNASPDSSGQKRKVEMEKEEARREEIRGEGVRKDESPE